MGSILIGVGASLGIPLIYATASEATGKDLSTAVLPMLYATLYVGQLLTPLLVTWGGKLFLWSNHQAYWIALLLSVILFLQAFKNICHHTKAPL